MPTDLNVAFHDTAVDTLAADGLGVVDGWLGRAKRTDLPTYRHVIPLGPMSPTPPREMLAVRFEPAHGADRHYRL